MEGRKPAMNRARKVCFDENRLSSLYCLYLSFQSLSRRMDVNHTVGKSLECVVVADDE